MKHIIILVIIGLLILPIQQLCAQNEAFFWGHQLGLGARALAMGGAFSAVADDYTASYWNPAGLAQIRRMEMVGSMSHLNLDNTSVQPPQNSLKSSIRMTESTSATKIEALGFVLPYPTYRGSLVFAIGYNRIRDFDNGFYISNLFAANTDTSYQRSFTESENGSLTNWVFSGAIDVTKKLSLGVSMNIWRGNDDYLWTDEYDDQKNIYYYDYKNDLSINTDFSAFNFKLGLLYRLAFLGKLSLTMQTPIKLKSEEQWEDRIYYFDNFDPAYADSGFVESDNGNWDYKIQSPYIFGAGFAFTMLPNLTISADVEYSDWSQMKYTSEPSIGEQNESNLDFKRNYEATTQYRIGAEFIVPWINMQLRAGFFNLPQPLKDVSTEDFIEDLESDLLSSNNLQILKSNNDKKFLTAGVGLLLDKQVKLDVAWTKGWWDEESELGEFGSIIEEIEVNKFLVSIAYRF